MPLYDYKCDYCYAELKDVFKPISERREVFCVSCNERMSVHVTKAPGVVTETGYMDKKLDRRKSIPLERGVEDDIKRARQRIESNRKDNIKKAVKRALRIETND